MNVEIAEKWATALESGQYKQARQGLCTPEGFCCLGVLTDLHRIETGKGHWAPVERILDLKYLSEDGGASWGYLPRIVQTWAGVKTAHGRYGRYGGNESLMEDNDVLGASFIQIAQTIRSNVEAL